MPEIRPADLTLTDLIGLGEEAVTDRLPSELLVALARRYVAAERRKRQRSQASRAERKAYGMTGDRIDARAQQASAEAALAAKVVWHDILDVRITSPGAEGQTWGTATVEDHLFAAQAREAEGATHIRTAAMHRRAVADIDAAGTRNLNETTMGLR
jgi:hypothetical protein